MSIKRIKTKKFPEYDRHESVTRIENRELGVVGFIAVHRRKGENPSLGATRLWSYGEESEALRDALRLSWLMSYKSAFAELPYGGAKAALVLRGEMPDREELFAWYAEAVNSLKGKFVTGSDVGVSPQDVERMRAGSRFIIGNGVPAEHYTAVGVVKSIEAALEAVYGSPAIQGRTFAVQGLGKTGLGLVRLLYPHAKKITVSDVSPEKLQDARKEFPQLVFEEPSRIHQAEADVFSPCALHHSVNARTVKELHCRAVVGSANNQLESAQVGEELHARGILYAPDYVANNGGLISVADQYAGGTHDDARIMRQIEHSQEKLKGILVESKATGTPPVTLADRHAASMLA
ncbi:MAG: leucine dehydrogenase [Candidatus Liptonbacteria bacterium]|nr:leucine dehydrogenase [Candidatus Liptonbacteria bacterium]